MLKSSFGFIFIIIIAASVFVPIDLPYGFNSTAKVFPLQRWVLQKGQDGILVASLHDYKTGIMKDYTSFEFDRGDIINIKFNPLHNERKVEAGQQIASILSNTLGEQIIKLESQLMIEEANLENVRTGEKIQIIDRAQEEVALAEEQIRISEEALDLQSKNYNRYKKLYEEGVIALAELEVYENNLNQAHISVDVAKSRVEVSKTNIEVNNTGEKPEQILLFETRINAIKNQIEFLNQKNGNFSIDAPISGKLSFETDSFGDRIIIEDTTQHILLIPIKIKDREYVNQQSQIDIDLVGVDSTIQATLVEVSSKIEKLNNDLVVLAKASVDGDVGFINSGMPVRCKVNCGKITPYEYLRRSVKVEIK